MEEHVLKGMQWDGHSTVERGHKMLQHTQAGDALRMRGASSALRRTRSPVLAAAGGAGLFAGAVGGYFR